MINIFICYSKTVQEFDQSNKFENNLTKKQWLAIECKKPEYKSPCELFQRWECVSDGHEMRIRKCRRSMIESINRRFRKQKCYCINDSKIDPYYNSNSNFNGNDDGSIGTNFNPKLVIKRKKPKILNTFEKKQKILDPFEKKLQRRFLKEHIINKDFKPIFIGSRSKRSISDGFLIDEFDIDGVYKMSEFLHAKSLNQTNDLDHLNDESFSRINNNINGLNECVILKNNTVSCLDENVYQNKQVWKEKKERLNSMIEKLQIKLEELRDIRRHLNEKRRLIQGHNRQPTNCFCDFKSGYRNHFKPRYVNRKHFRYHDKSKRNQKKHRRKTKFQNTTCNYEKMNCFTHDNQHWKTAPFWTSMCQFQNNYLSIFTLFYFSVVTLFFLFFYFIFFFLFSLYFIFVFLLYFE